jgi:hypothetical protein
VSELFLFAFPQIFRKNKISTLTKSFSLFRFAYLTDDFSKLLRMRLDTSNRFVRNFENKINGREVIETGV